MRFDVDMPEVKSLVDILLEPASSRCVTDAVKVSHYYCIIVDVDSCPLSTVSINTLGIVLPDC